MIDTFNDWNPNNPINQESKQEDFEVEENQIESFKELLRIERQRTAYKTAQLQKLAEFEECIRTFGSLTYEQQTEKNEILNQYNK